jgi:hypothetical protein
VSRRANYSSLIQILNLGCRGARRASGFAGRRRYACRETARASSSVGVAASTDACGRHMPGAPMRRTCRWTTRITEAELAATNRRARFPASQRVGTLRIAPACEPTCLRGSQPALRRARLFHATSAGARPRCTSLTESTQEASAYSSERPGIPDFGTSRCSLAARPT